MAKGKISSKDFLDLLDEQNDQSTPELGSFGRRSIDLSNLATLSQKPEVKTGHKPDTKLNTNRTQA